MASWWKWGLGIVGLAGAGVGVAYVVTQAKYHCRDCKGAVTSGYVSRAVNTYARPCRACAETAVAQYAAIAQLISGYIQNPGPTGKGRDYWERELLALPGNVALLAERAGIEGPQLEGW